MKKKSEKEKNEQKNGIKWKQKEKLKFCLAFHFLNE